MLENMSKKRWLTLLAVCIAVTIVRVMLQPLIPEGENPMFTTYSAIYNAGLLVPAFVVFAFVVSLLLGIVFVLIEGRLPGTRLAKGVAFGMAYGLMWAVYLLEPLTKVLEGSFFVLYGYPIVDGLTFGMLGLLLGVFVGTDSKGPAKRRIGSETLALLAIPVAFVVIRLCCYAFSIIGSAFDIRPADTMLWAAGTGLWLGVMYFLLRPGVPGKSPLAKALFFGPVVIGINLFFFNSFVPLVFEVDYADLILRTLVDIVSVTIGVYVCEKIGSVIGSRSQADR
ncbi:MAG: hypothetical protein WBZ29_00355 [Methanocella sp.]